VAVVDTHPQVVSDLIEAIPKDSGIAALGHELTTRQAAFASRIAAAIGTRAELLAASRQILAA
jgi:hypothetical protein